MRPRKVVSNSVNPSIQKFIVLPAFVAVRKNAISLVYFAHSDFRFRSFSPPCVRNRLKTSRKDRQPYYPSQFEARIELPKPPGTTLISSLMPERGISTI